jgi:hypothetical protein
MNHRHLSTNRLTSAAVDDIIRRGGWRDWVLLRRAAHTDPEVLLRIRRVCAAVQEIGSEGWQRLAFWNSYVRQHASTLG